MEDKQKLKKVQILLKLHIISNVKDFFRNGKIKTTNFFIRF